jgi:hypothetical protein
MKKKTLYLLLAILIISQIMSMIKINNLQRQLGELDRELTRFSQRIMNDVDAIYSNVDEKLKQKASLIESATTELGRVNKEELTVPVIFTLTPKQVTEQTLVSLDFDGELFPMERSGATFSVTIDCKIFSEASPKIVIDESGAKSITHDDQVCIRDIKGELLPRMYPRLLGGSSFNGNSYKRKGSLIADTKESPSEIKFTSVQLLIKVDEKVISEKELDLQVLEARVDGYEIDEEIELSDGQICTMTVIATDSMGLKHHYLVDHFLAGSKAQREPWLENEKIYSSDGRLLWESE